MVITPEWCSRWTTDFCLRHWPCPYRAFEHIADIIIGVLMAAPRCAPLLSPPQIPSCHSLPHPPTISILAPFEVSLRWLLWSIHIVLARMIWVSEIMRNSKRGANTLLIWVVDSSVDLLHEGLVSNILDQITAFRTCTNNREMANRTLRTIYLVTYLGSHK